MRPIIFSSEMVKAILEGRKTQTRRVINPQPVTDFKVLWWQWAKIEPIKCVDFKIIMPLYCPYGRVGDRLWVKESWRTIKDLDSLAPCELDKESSAIFFEADGLDNADPIFGIGKKRSSLFMPRWASRITLEITGVKVERLQEITIRDCHEEGLPYGSNVVGIRDGSVILFEFKQLWDSLNAKRGYGWDKNFWVWVVNFKQVISNTNPELSGQPGETSRERYTGQRDIWVEQSNHRLLCPGIPNKTPAAGGSSAERSEVEQ